MAPAARAAEEARALASHALMSGATLRRLGLFAIVVRNVSFGTEKFPEPWAAWFACKHSDLVRIWILADLGVFAVGQGKVAHVRLAGVDDLVGNVGPAGGAGDDVVLADAIALAPESKFTFAFKDH